MPTSLFSDLRFSLRVLMRRPGFAAVAVATLAIGIGAVSTVFSLVNAILIEGLPFDRADRLVFMRGVRTGDTPQQYPLGLLDIEALRESRVFGALSPVTGPRPFNLRAGETTEHVTAEMVGAEYFSALRVAIARGRGFTTTEAAPQTAAPVAIISDALWQTRFGADADILDTVIDLNDRRYHIVGVAAPGFAGLGDNADLWLPIGMAGAIYGPHYTETRQFRWLSAIARLDDDVNLARARLAIEAVAARLQLAFPVENQRIGFSATSLEDVVFGAVRTPLLVLMAAAGLLLVLASVNVANLLLARGAARTEELAVRRALGADSARLAGQIAVETVTLCAIGAIGGLALAATLPRVAYAWAPETMRQFVDVRFDPAIILAAVAATTMAALVAGVVPAVLMVRQRPVQSLRTRSSAGGARQRWQRALVAAEVAIAAALLIGAAAMTRGLSRFVDTDLGLRSEGVMTLRLDLTAERFKDNGAYWSLVRDVSAHAAAVPGVASVAIEGPGFPTSGSYAISFRRIGGSANDPDIGALRHHVTPGYFATLGIAIVAGRDFGPADVPGGDRALIVSREFADTTWPGRSPIGERLAAGAGADAPVFTVVGLAENVRHGGRTTARPWAPDVYLNLLQTPARSPAVLTVYARSHGTADLVRAPLVAAARAGAAGVPPYDVRPLDERLAAQTATPRFAVLIMGTFAVAAFLLAVVGVFGVVSHLVSQRRREMGLRMALGSSRRRVLLLMLRIGLLPVAVGVGCGIAVAAFGGRYLGSLLYGIPATDPVHVLVMTSILAAVAGGAILLPAIGATRVSPSTVLADE